MSTLKQKLFNEYGGFADKRYKKLESCDTFAIDGRTSADLASDDGFYGWFCAMFADTSEEPIIRVRLVKNVPAGPEVSEWIKRYKASLVKAPDNILEFSVAPGEQNRLVELAAAVEAIVKPGRRYRVAAYKYLCPRVGKCLRRLASVLDTQWSAA